MAALRHELGLDLPYYQQLFNYIKNAIHGDFGNSYQLRMPVWDIIKLRFPLTLQLTTFTMLIAVLIGVPVGILSAVKQYSVIDAFSVIFALLMASIPAFWLGMLLMLLFSLNLGWLPSSGYEGVKWLILPSITLGFINCATIMRMTRSSMLEVLGTDYIRTARAKGPAPPCAPGIPHRNVTTEARVWPLQSIFWGPCCMRLQRAAPRRT